MTKRARPKQHTRKIKTKKGKKKIMVNKGVKKVKVKSFKRGKHKVKGYARRKRKLGKKITYKTIGKFQLGHDEFGNIRGSKVIIEKKKKKPAKKVKRKRISKAWTPGDVARELEQAEEDYFAGKFKTAEEYFQKRKDIIG
jgi:hypothetical protein